ncbi:MAG: RagB/SusD family nutrient uptake outer membrane protein [Tannerellaceae bacterium]|nr:RagB/SusD family nutrient uptake outer membrane protein [Tannerellaceae bacterium]
MRKYIVSAVVLASLLVLASCEDFLDRNPETSITAKDYFKVASDLETYSNRFYQELISPPIDDVGSDNVTISTNANTMYSMVNSNGISSSNVGEWNTDDWTQLRRINYMLNNIHPGEMSIAEADLNHYTGIARFFRGDYYYKKVKKYNSVPFYNKAMDDTDEDLYKPADPRELVVDSVISDLEFAATHIKPALGQRTRLNQYAALALLARVCLHEATCRKYHTELGLTASADAFFDKAINACRKITDSGLFELYGSSAKDYGALFCMPELRDNKEILLFVEYDQTLGKGNNTHTVLGMYWGLSRSLMETYQMKDGSDFSYIKPDGTYKTYVELFENRDPRLAETFAYPGFNVSPEIEGNSPYIPKTTYGGMDQIKFFPKETSQRLGWGMNYISVPYFRYAEVLLILAEAKAERGTLSQTDLDQSINLIRKRAGMPPVNLSANALDDIRRERRVELACEGLRLDDVMRWAKGRELMGARPQGIYIHGYGAYDVTGDGEPDVAILHDAGDLSPIAHLPADVQAKIEKEFLYDANNNRTSIYLSNADGKSGFMEFVTSENRKWEDKFYYVPIPKQQLLLNPELKQPPGWE